MIKKIFLFFFVLFIAVGYSQVGLPHNKVLTTVDSSLKVICLGEWLEITVIDSGAADTVNVYYPFYDPRDSSITPVPIKRLMDATTGDYCTELAGTVDAKMYVIFLLYPRVVEFVLSDYASGDVYIRVASKP